MFDRFNQTIFQLWDDIVRYINGNMFQWEIFTLFKKRMSMWWHYYSSADYQMNTSLPIPEITMKFHSICQHILYYLQKKKHISRFQRKSPGKIRFWSYVFIAYIIIIHGLSGSTFNITLSIFIFQYNQVYGI